MNNKDSFLFQKELDNLLDNCNLPVNLVYNIIKVRELQLYKIYYDYAAQQAVYENKLKKQQQQKQEEVKSQD